ncbi:MAG: copper resistance protein NlpE N-terminal domain-containing protein [Taibaiella sp.]|nr:copper resistance protein NlpE N-terminal domain-containing protein [Taibaiella sp.]
MKSKLIILTVFSSLLFVSCGNHSKNESNNNTEMPGTPGLAAVVEAAESLSGISGTYTGNLPCTDCDGIKTTLILNDDKSYEIDEQYAGRKETNKTIGTHWTVTDSILTLDSLKGMRPHRYKIEDESLVQLDMNGEKITGPIADKFILKKQ